MKNG
jgi:hypothetical protein